MKKFLEPELEILLFNVEDVITASGLVDPSDPDNPNDPIVTPMLPM